MREILKFKTRYVINIGSTAQFELRDVTVTLCRTTHLISFTVCMLTLYLNLFIPQTRIQAYYYNLLMHVLYTNIDASPPFVIVICGRRVGLMVRTFSRLEMRCVEKRRSKVSTKILNYLLLTLRISIDIW